MDVKLINELEKEISNDYSFSRNTRRKNYFLAACKSLDPEINLLQIDEQSPFGGIIGIDDSPLDRVLSFSKVFRLHAVLHDASGFMKRELNVGPGYCYVFRFDNKFPNFCFLGHLTGISYCLYLKFFFPSLFETFRV